MAGDGVHGADWGSVAAAGPGSDPGTVSVPDSRFSFRQRQRIRQPYGGPTLKQAADRTDQVATAAQQRQRIGGNQEWRCNPQAYGHIAAPHAEAIGRFYGEYLNPYVNLHRPCAQAEIETNEKGKQTRRYRRYQTPLETLLTLPHPESHLRPGVTLGALEQQALRHSDTEAARQMQAAKQKLFAGFRRSA